MHICILHGLYKAQKCFISFSIPAALTAFPEFDLIINDGLSVSIETDKTGGSHWVGYHLNSTDSDLLDLLSPHQYWICLKKKK